MFVVEIANTITGNLRNVGPFESEDKAREYLVREVAKSRSFVEFTIYTGTPKNTGKKIGETVKGAC